MARLATALPGAFALAEQGYTISQIARELNVALWAVKYWATVNDITLAKYRHSLKPAAERAVALARDGLYVSQIAHQTGMSVCGVKDVLRREGVIAGKFVGKRGPFMLPKNIERAEKMASMYRQGLPLEKIGQQYGVTRERVRQILKKLGVVRADSLRSKQKANGQAVRQARAEAASLVRWGVPRADAKKYRGNGLIPAYTSQRNSASGRGIKWDLLFADWLAIWQESGKLELRGRGKGRYVMSRIKDEGGYVMGNVHIQLSTDNNSEGLKKCRNNKAKTPGVWMIYPGLSKPWVAKAGRAYIGTFATEAEGVAARQQYLAEHPKTGRGQGYAVRTKGKHTYYQVMVGRRYIGNFKTPDAALAARAAAILQPACEAA